MVKAWSAQGIVGALVVALGSISCGGSSNGAGGQACSTYAAAFCKRIYACTPAAMQDADFHTNYGSSEVQCAQQESLICNATLPAGQTALGTNCSGGKHVSMPALSVCQTQLETVTCDEFLMDPYANNCADVCTSGATGTASGGAGGASNTGSGGNKGSGGSGGSGNAAGAIAFCKSTEDRLCDLTFQCTPAAERDATFTSTYGSTASECKTMQEAADCTADQLTGCMFNASAAASCLSALNAADCNSDILSIESCGKACRP